ncbi:endonuclease dU [Thermococcus sp.]
MIRKVKPEIRTVGFDDGTFSFSSKLSRDKTVLVGVVMKGSSEVVGVLSRWITVDGMDATEAIADAVVNSRFKDLRVMMLKGITYAGFNVVDLEELHSMTGLPVVVVIRKRPDLNAMEAALRKHFEDAEERIRLLRKAPPLHEIIPGKLYIQALGVDERTAEEIVRTTTKTGLIPEPLRLAHMIASALMRGESTKE